MSYMIAAISNSGGAPEQAYRKMQSAGASPERPFAEMFKFEVPSLTVGTLDTLMNLSDELGKTDQIVESIVRKIEKTAIELAATNTTQRGGGGSSGQSIELSVGGVPSSRYIQQFAWDSAKYPNRRPLKELVSLISGGTISVEEEMKQLQQSYTEKITSLNEIKKRKGGNLLNSDLNELLTEEIMSKVKIIDSEYLKTIFIAIPKNLHDNFKNTIYKIGKDIVGYGGPNWTNDPTKLGEPISFGSSIDRHKIRGSPVVPNSVQRVHADEDSILYSCTILRGQYEAGYYDENNEFQHGTTINFEDEFAKACRDKRFMIRSDFVWDSTQSTKASMQLEQLTVEVDGMKSALIRWCKNHYGDAYVAWIHIKVIRVFVESVLRYGLPVDFTAVLYKVHRGKDNDLMNALDKQLGNNANTMDKDDVELDDEEFHDFVLLKFEP